MAAKSSERQGYHPTAPFPVVGIGASAGGLEALKGFLSHLPDDTGMAFVLVQHLDPTHESALSELLARATQMAVVQAAQGMRVEPNHFYVIPPNANMEIQAGTLHLTPRAEPRGQHMPVDLFLRSLAKERGTRAIAVILSGSASDGALGLNEVKAEGGITFAQDETAKYNGMPRSAIATGHVDFVLPPDGIADELVEMEKHPYLTRRRIPKKEVVPSETKEDLLKISALLRRTKGLDLSLYKDGTLSRRISRRMALSKLENLGDYLSRLRENPAEVEALFQDILIHVTGFFRDPEVFEALKTVVFPALMTDRTVDEPLRIWVPGCSTGEEVYSIAISLFEFLGENASSFPIKIFATDVSDRAVEAGRAGVYLENVASDISPDRLRRFFVKVPNGYQVNKTIRESCVFAKKDLTKDPPFSKLDLISCRNVLIYFGPTLQKKVLPVFHYSLKPNGFLMLGSSEAVGHASELFELKDRKHKVYAKSPTSSPRAFEYPITTRSTNELFSSHEAKNPRKPSIDLDKEVDRLLAAEYSPPGVIISEDLGIVQVRGKTGPYLELSPGNTSVNILKMAREGLRLGLQAAVEEAKKSGSITRREGLRVKTNDHYTEIHLRVFPLQGQTAEGKCFLILFEEASPSAQSEPHDPTRRFLPRLRTLLLPKTAPIPADPDAASIENAELRKELNETKLFLQSLVQEQEASNEELRAANEEILSSNEELLITNEELETAKEELQATNEELGAVNEELQNRSMEMETVNDDLSNLLNSTDIPIIMLGVDLRIRRFTPTAAKALNLIPSDIGRPIGDLKPKIDAPDLVTIVEVVVETFLSAEREVQDRDGRWYHMNVRPYRTAEKKVEGAVITLIDIDQIKRAAEGLRRLATVVRDSNDAITVRCFNGKILSWNRGAEEMYGYTETEALAMNTADLLPENLRNQGVYLLSRLASGERIESFETKRLTKDGRVLEVWLTATILVDDAGIPEAVATTERDITERKQAEEVLREESAQAGQKLHWSEARNRSIVETAIEGIITIDGKGLVESFNSAAQKIFGYEAAEVIGENVRMLMPQPYQEEHDGYLVHYLETGEKKIIGIGREVVGQRKDGSTFPMDLSVSEIHDGESHGFTGIVRDITERKQAESALTTRVRQQAIVADLGGKALLGAEPQELMDQAALRVTENLDVEMCKILELLPGGQKLLLRSGVGWKDGLVRNATVGADLTSQAGYTLIANEPVIVEDLSNETRFTGPSLLFDHGVLSGMSVVIRGESKPFGVLSAHTTKHRKFTREDVYFLEGIANVLGEALTNKRHVAQLLKQESLAHLGEMASFVAHEVKNPMAGIGGALRMLQRRMAADTLEYELCEEMTSRISNLTSLVNSILLYARPREPRMRPVPLRALLDDTVLAISQDPQFANVDVSIAGPELTLSCDHEMLKPVFLNLCLNAAQAMEGKGNLSITVARTNSGADCSIVFRDSGPGISRTIRQRIFEPFFTTKGKGTGLGLPLAKRVIELHGGKISVDCPPDGGTTVSIELPLLR